MSLEEDESFSINEIPADEDVTVRQKPAPMLGALPDVALQHLAPFLPWSSCRSLSQVNFRFRECFSTLLTNAFSLSVKGTAAVGFYVVHVQMDEQVAVSWELKTESGVRTVVRKVFGGLEAVETTRSVLVSSRNYLQKILEWLLAKFHFKKVHLGVSGLSRFFANYAKRVEDFGASDEVDYLELAETFQPKKLTLFQPSLNNSKRGELDLNKFPHLEDLRVFGIPVDPMKLLGSGIVRVAADTISAKISLKQVLKMIEDFKQGVLPQKEIKIIGEIGPWPVRTSHENWESLARGKSEFAFRDEVHCSPSTRALVDYSPGSLEFFVVRDP